MDETLKKYCDLLSENRNIIQKVFRWDSDVMRLACAAVFTIAGKTADAQQLKQCEKLLRSRERFFSEFRGNLRLIVMAKMALSDDPEVYWAHLRAVYCSFMKNRVFGEEYCLLAAIQLLEQVEPDRISEAVERTYAIHDRMRKAHPWLTGRGDLPMAAVLAVRKLNPEVLFEEMEACYQLLREKFHAGESAQICSHVMSVSGAGAERKCSRMFAIWDGLKQSRHRYGTGKELAILAALSLLDQPTESIVRDILEADEELSKKKGFGFFLIGFAQRRMYAAQIVLNAYAKDGSTVDSSVISSSVALSIAQAVCASVVATTTASAAVHNS